MNWFTHRYKTVNVLESRFYEIQRKIIEFKVRNKVVSKLKVEDVQSKVDELILDSQQIYTSLKQSPTYFSQTVESKPMFNANIPLRK